ncbi:low molecular weight phosphotyrosine protein phosphatase-like [Cimex lectularius]|uniref:Low molecular weight phosphotyrosine protein phosphatase n=1 Tax=Cimex lectularius TaxID=79782 RepID=A0A8I6RS77_CIMLE|nr:low molecular weight phosphotyrosine protein phosphatase-like [Cimex lectularius]XP_014251565.1 low molecular weight phosphotyrosine protein phosphatase-like [Cimex lectularius]
MSKGRKSVLFICLGNICRSPLAEAVFLHLIKERGLEDEWDVDSAALGPWHVGNGPDSRTMKVLKENNIPYSHSARQIEKADFNKYDYIFGMDHDNMSELNRLAPKNSTAKLELLGSYDPNGELIIKDPYYKSGDSGFYKCYDQCLRSCTAFLDKN